MSEVSNSFRNVSTQKIVRQINDIKLRREKERNGARKAVILKVKITEGRDREEVRRKCSV